jgi:hypothetical protein
MMENSTLFMFLNLSFEIIKYFDFKLVSKTLLIILFYFKIDVDNLIF